MYGEGRACALGVGYGIVSRKEGEDLGQVWEQRRLAERLPQGMTKGRGGGTGEHGLPGD